MCSPRVGHCVVGGKDGVEVVLKGWVFSAGLVDVVADVLRSCRCWSGRCIVSFVSMGGGRKLLICN